MPLAFFLVFYAFGLENISFCFDRIRKLPDIVNMESKELFKKLRTHVRENGAMDVALFLGYKTPQTIERWLTRDPKRIPPHMERYVWDFFRAKEEVENEN